MKLPHSGSLISFLLILSMLSPSESAGAASLTETEGSDRQSVESRLNRIAAALQQREDRLDLDTELAPDQLPWVAQFRNAFRNGGGGFRNGGFRNRGSSFVNRPGGGFVNRPGGGFANRPAWRNAFRNSPGFYNYRY